MEGQGHEELVHRNLHFRYSSVGTISGWGWGGLGTEASICPRTSERLVWLPRCGF